MAEISSKVFGNWLRSQVDFSFGCLQVTILAQSIEKPPNQLELGLSNLHN